jgi:hypothetical protein
MRRILKEKLEELTKPTTDLWHDSLRTVIPVYVGSSAKLSSYYME